MELVPSLLSIHLHSLRVYAVRVTPLTDNSGSCQSLTLLFGISIKEHYSKQLEKKKRTDKRRGGRWASNFRDLYSSNSRFDGMDKVKRLQR